MMDYHHPIPSSHSRLVALDTGIAGSAALRLSSHGGLSLATHQWAHMQNERVLFHYNGHGVPRPTVNGEIWVFNKSYTQYIPMSIYDLQSWVGSPCIYVLDCSAAGLLIPSFRSFAEQRAQVCKSRRKQMFSQHRQRHHSQEVLQSCLQRLCRCCQGYRQDMRCQPVEANMETHVYSVRPWSCHSTSCLRL